MYYYRIFDDKEEMSFFKSSLEYDRIVVLMKEYEKTHDEYINMDFIAFLKEKDKEAEIIEVNNISY